MTWEIRKVRPNAIIPAFKTDGAAGMDLHACIDKPIHLWPQKPPVMIPTGIAISIISPGWCAMCLPRSGTGLKGLVMANTVGLIDSDYQGEYLIAAWNRNPTPPFGDGISAIVINPGDRIAQVVFIPVGHPELKIVDEFSVKTVRGAGGFGSTGVAA